MVLHAESLLESIAQEKTVSKVTKIALLLNGRTLRNL